MVKHRFRGTIIALSIMRTTNDAPEAQQLLKWLRSVGVAK